jgi:hypothetical protein
MAKITVEVVMDVGLERCCEGDLILNDDLV